MSKIHKYLVAAALTVAAAIPAQLSAQVALAPGAWQDFFWYEGAGYSVDGAGFTTQSSTQLMRIRITDVGVNGDAFDIYIDGVKLYETPSVQGPGYVEQELTYDPDEAYGNGLLSYFEFFLNPQVDPYLITLTVRETAPDFSFGGGYLRLDEFEVNSTPEPATLLLLATGFAGVAAVARRRTNRPT